MKNKLFYFTPIIGVALFMALYTIVINNYAISWTTVGLCALALAIYFGITFGVNYLLRPKNCQADEIKDFPFNFKFKINENTNVLYGVLRAIGVFFSIDYVCKQNALRTLNDSGKRKFTRRVLYVNLLITAVLFVLLYLLLNYKVTQVAKVVKIIFLVKLVSVYVDLLIDCLGSLFDRASVSWLTPAKLVEFSIVKALELFIVFTGLYLVFTMNRVYALYCGLHFFTLNSVFFNWINARTMYLLLLQTALMLLLVITVVINYIIMHKRSKENLNEKIDK